MPIKYEISVRKEGTSDDEWLILQALAPSSVFENLAAFSSNGNWLCKVKIQDAAGSTSPTDQIMLFSMTGATISKRGLFRRADDLAAYGNVLEYIRNSSAIFTTTQVLEDALLDIGLGVLALPADIADSTGIAKPLISRRNRSSTRTCDVFVRRCSLRRMAARSNSQCSTSRKSLEGDCWLSLDHSTAFGRSNLRSRGRYGYICRRSR